MILALYHFRVSSNWAHISLVCEVSGVAFTVNRGLLEGEKKGSPFLTNYFAFQNFLSDFEVAHFCLTQKSIVVVADLTAESRYVLSLSSRRVIFSVGTPLLRVKFVFPTPREGSSVVSRG